MSCVYNIAKFFCNSVPEINVKREYNIEVKSWRKIAGTHQILEYSELWLWTTWCVKETERLVKNWPVNLLLVLRTQKVGGSSGQLQMMARVNIAKEEAAILSEPCHAAPVTIQKLLQMRWCLTKCSEKN